MASVKASQQGLIKIKQAMARQGWKWDSDRPLLEASKFLEPQKKWDKPGLYANGCSQKSWKRFLQRIPIRPKSFEAFCQALGIDPDQVAQSNLKEDWGEAPYVPILHGRQQELATLEQWIIQDQHRLINIVGFAGIGKTNLVSGGIGKTDLSLQLARKVRGDFEYLIWRRLLNAPSLEILLTELIEFVSDNQETQLTTTTDGLITQLLHHLKQRRCLLILDNVESILQSKDQTKNYRSGYEEYGNFFQRIGTSKHQSCLLLTSRVKPTDIELIEGFNSVQILELDGLDMAAGRAIFQDIARANNTSFQGTEDDWSNLVAFYSGNPLALEVTARHILKQYGGDLAEFLKHDLRVFGTIRDLLDWHFVRLTVAEKNVLYWLALNREALSIAELKQDLVSAVERKYLPETLDALERHIPIEKNADRLTLQPVLIEYLSEKVIAEVCQELESGKPQILNSHALIKASAKDYVKDSQIRLILQPIIDRWNATSGLELQNSLENRLSKLLETLNRQIPGYTAGNLLNLMRYAGIDLSGYDFSGMTIWQADLQDINLHRVNFAGCKFANCSLTQNFGGVQAIAISPDGELLAVGDSLGKIYLYRLRDQQQFLTLEGHLEDTLISSLTFSPDNELLASSSLDHDVKIWDVSTGQCCQTFKGHQQWVWSVAFSPDAKLIASGSDDDTVRVWNLSTGECQVLKGSKKIWAVAFHPEGNILASGGHDRTVRFWDVATGKCLKILQGHQAAVWAIAFNADGQTLASGSMDKTIKLWEVETGRCLHTLQGHTREVRSLAFSSGDHLISGSFDCTVRLWDTVKGNLIKTLTGCGGQIWAVAANFKNSIFASGDISQIIKLWNYESGKCLKTIKGYTNWIWAIAISPDRRLLASGSLDKVVRIWDLETGIVTATLEGHQNMIWSVAFSPDGQLLASCGDDASIKLWDTTTGQCLNTFFQDPSQKGIWTLKFGSDGQLVSGGINGLIQVWDVLTGNLLRSIEAHSGWIWAVTFSPDEKYLASCSQDRTIKLWDINTESCLTHIKDDHYDAMSVAFCPNSQMLVSGNVNSQIKLWDIKTGDCLQNFSGHTGSIWAIAFINERTFASASADETIRLWDIDTGKCIEVLTGHTAWVRAIVVTAEGQQLISSSKDGTIRIWNLVTGKTLKILRPKRPYEEMNITEVQGLTVAQKQTLVALGAKD